MSSSRAGKPARDASPNSLTVSSDWSEGKQPRTILRSRGAFPQLFPGEPALARSRVIQVLVRASPGTISSTASKTEELPSMLEECESGNRRRSRKVINRNRGLRGTNVKSCHNIFLLHNTRDPVHFARGFFHQTQHIRACNGIESSPVI